MGGFLQFLFPPCFLLRHYFTSCHKRHSLLQLTCQAIPSWSISHNFVSNYSSLIIKGGSCCCLDLTESAYKGFWVAIALLTLTKQLHLVRVSRDTQPPGWGPAHAGIHELGTTPPMSNQLGFINAVARKKNRDPQNVMFSMIFFAELAYEGCWGWRSWPGDPRPLCRHHPGVPVLAGQDEHCSESCCI